MNKKLVVFIFAVLLCQGLTAYAAPRGTAEYEKMKAYKKAQHEKKKLGPAEKGFWQREAERSGLAGTAAMIVNVPGSIIPLDKPNSRK